MYSNTQTRKQNNLQSLLEKGGYSLASWVEWVSAKMTPIYNTPIMIMFKRLRGRADIDIGNLTAALGNAHVHGRARRALAESGLSADSPIKNLREFATRWDLGVKATSKQKLYDLIVAAV
jgi:hypothetical protein